MPPYTAVHHDRRWVSYANHTVLWVGVAVTLVVVLVISVIICRYRKKAEEIVCGNEEIPIQRVVYVQSGPSGTNQYIVAGTAPNGVFQPQSLQQGSVYPVIPGQVYSVNGTSGQQFYSTQQQTHWREPTVPPPHFTNRLNTM
ncbi:hypothetical protein BCR33DRAFT_850471 [Rhizoclosmatium globosum]|uniref:Uncharacterized protein n=1 Tax=Rhizoclosmatium globosum TaxID=329046 RepID=A0A1Y2CBB2_9FUNG|nr:hypothetical protein BCR33DRAFT_850471 [Rhizoclosmatium globosum]|eukprot:ORY44341.1 hypothetical protein BCR33DRAFT_850471 [Rhizoclosmatium globosum]